METRALAPLYTPTSLNPLTGAVIVGTLQSSVTVTAGIAAVASTLLPGGQTCSFAQVQIANTTTAWAYVNFGVLGAVVAATVAASYPVGPGAVVVVSVPAEVSGASVILGAASTGGTAVIFTRGEGL
jgi:hypothetical protein